MDRAAWSRTLARVNGQLDSHYELGDPLTGGRQGGAWTVRDAAATTRVLTWTVNAGLARRRDETTRLVGALIDKGYPTPTWRHSGAFDDGLTYVITDFMPGRTATWLSVPIEQVVAAVELQADVARPSGETWSGYVREALRPGSTPRRAVAELGHIGAQFLTHVDARLPDLTAVTLPKSDAVHGDLEAGNILVGRDAQTLGIIDMDACGPGTRALDYAWLLRDAWVHDADRAAIEVLETMGEDVAGPDVFAACLSLACVELVAFVAARDPYQAQEEIARLTPLLVQRPNGHF